ncbi:MAG TPA: xanthine dehydrogenase family protein molybdopterin-binding subunit [Amycolatopsis sp.]|nr:xanthine dehydrogenase family protein molybdopterin-binding subunit [Amycolatopsis sp.]
MLGKPVRRLEDRRLLLGRGRFHDDVSRPAQLWLRVIRSPVAHARIRGIDTAAALASPGVAGVYTAADFPVLPRIPVRQVVPGLDLDPYLQPVLATGFVRYVGDPVAVVLAEDPYLAEDAADLVGLDLRELPVTLDAREAAELPQESWGGRTPKAAVVEIGYGDVDRVFETAPRVVRVPLKVGRHGGTPLEPRGLVADYDEVTDRMTIWGATKVPHWNRRVLAQLLGIAEHRIHMTETDAGGGFGVRGELYPEDILVPYLCLRTRRAVKWSEDRTEHLLAANHSREQEHTIELAFDEEGHLLGLRDEVWQNNGGYIRTHGAAVGMLTATMMPGPYRLPAYRTRVHVVTTNKSPTGTYRAPGRYEVTFVREHALDIAAGELGMDPVDLRRRNLLDHRELPHTRPIVIYETPMVLDGKDYLEHFDKSLAAAGYRAWREEARAAREAGRLIGTGCAFFVEKAGLGPHDSAIVEVDTTGAVRVAMGGTNVGQGIETVMAQVVAEELDIAPEAVGVVLSDTDILPDGAGTWASRSTVVGGSAVQRAAEEVVGKARRVASDMLEVSPDDLRIENGTFVVAGVPGKRVTLAEIVRECFTARQLRNGEEPGLIGRGTFVVDVMTYPYGVHCAQVEIDPGTGGVRLLRYAIGYEIGRSLNPLIVDGQLQGGLAQGIGGALFEEFTYDASGKPLNTTLADYQWPRALDVPEAMITVFEDAPAPDNPLGVRGAGEGGTTGCGGAIANAVRDALGLKGSVLALPLTPERVKALLRDRGGKP